MIKFVDSCPVAGEYKFVSVSGEILYLHRLWSEYALPSATGFSIFVNNDTIYSIAVVRDGRDIYLISDPGRFKQLEAVEKPGNLGAVLRSADASGVDAVIVCDPLTDMYNPNLIRSSIGAIFTVPVATASSEDTIKWLKSNGIKIYTAQLQDSEWYYDTDMKGGTAIVMGTEATGLTDAWRKAADAHIKIPMLGKLDSLNVSVSAAILMFEAVRQRNN